MKLNTGLNTSKAIPLIRVSTENNRREILLISSVRPPREPSATLDFGAQTVAGSFKFVNRFRGSRDPRFSKKWSPAPLEATKLLLKLEGPGRT